MLFTCWLFGMLVAHSLCIIKLENTKPHWLQTGTLIKINIRWSLLLGRSVGQGQGHLWLCCLEGHYCFTNISFHIVCPLCNSAVTNVFLHASCSCAYTLPLREEWWSDIINTDLVLCAELSGLPDDELFSILLGRPTLSPTDLHTFRMTNFRFLRNAAAAYNRALVSL